MILSDRIPKSSVQIGTTLDGMTTSSVDFDSHVHLGPAAVNTWAVTRGDLFVAPSWQPVALVEYASTIVRLRPGDIIATGTPGGVGHARVPQRFLTGGERVVTEIDGLGRLENLVTKENSP
jgi:2-keto-4-pentenoate hydratase/2-oxohepta-3-ene-1,7-dioic acid hydratase in catechol pathway